MNSSISINQQLSTSCFQHDQGNTKLQKPKLTRSNNCLGVPASHAEWDAIIDSKINQHSPWSSATDLVSMDQLAQYELALERDELALERDELALEQQAQQYTDFVNSMSAEEFNWTSSQLEYQWLMPSTAVWIPMSEERRQIQDIFMENNTHFVRTLEKMNQQRQIEERAMKVVRETKLQEDLDTYNLNSPNPKWLSSNRLMCQSPLFKENFFTNCTQEIAYYSCRRKQLLTEEDDEDKYVLDQQTLLQHTDFVNDIFEEDEYPYADPDYMHPVSREELHQKQAIVDARMVAYELAHPTDYSAGHQFTEADFAHLHDNFNMDELTQIYQEREKKAEELQTRLALIDYNATGQFTFQEEEADLSELTDFEIDADKNKINRLQLLEINRLQLIQEFCNRNGWNAYLKAEEAKEAEECELIEAVEDHDDQSLDYQYEDQEYEDQEYEDQEYEVQDEETDEPCLPPKPLRREEERDREDLLEQSRMYAEMCKLRLDQTK
jgi:hypothetical protein